MGCQSSIVKLKPNGSFIPTSNPEIDDLYKELDEAISQLNRQGGPMVVAIDTFVTVTGGSKYSASTAHGLVATLIVTLAELPQESQLVLMNQYPGLIVDIDRLAHIESLRAWELWRNLSYELLKAIADLDSYLSHALRCAEIPDSISKALTRLSHDSEIRVIDLRKLNIILEANRPVLLEAADSFHRSIEKVVQIVEESLAVLEGLRVEEMRRALLELCNEAALARIYDPQRIMILFKLRFETLVRNLLDRAKTTKH